MLEPNTVLLDRYLIERMLGQGGMGAVYLAIDQKFGSTVALKETLVSGDVLQRAFEREARLLNKLRHGALPVVMDYFCQDERQFLVMQFIPGEDLGALLAKAGRPFPVADVLEWADDLLDVLDYLHGQDPPVVHRDIKPQNLKLTPRGEIILLDFGLAKGDAASLTLSSATGSIFGYTPHYAPFEQIKGSGTDPRSDLYALAATLHHLLTARLPADAMSRAEAAMLRQEDPLPRVDTVNSDVPKAVGFVLERALAMDRNERFSSAGEMRAALAEATQGTIYQAPEAKTRAAGAPGAGTSGLPSQMETVRAGASPAADRTTAGPNVTTQPMTEAARRPAWLWPVLALVAVAAIAAAVGLSGVWRPTPRPQPAAPAEAAPPDLITTAPALTSFAFETATVSPSGAIGSRKQIIAQAFGVDLGNGVAIEMVRIPGGSFVMGSPADEPERFTDEGPQRTVTLSDFYLSKREVTQAEWRAVAALPKVKIDLPADPSEFKGDDLPVENVTWDQAMEFCARLTAKHHRLFRLPTERQWEYACRAGSTTPYAFGPTITTEIANYDGTVGYNGGPAGTVRNKTVPAASLRFANAFGLYDMTGNVWEWCLGEYHDSYDGAPADDRPWDQGGDPRNRVCRGGAWNSLAPDCRSANRFALDVYDQPRAVGVRVAMVAGNQ